MSDSILIKKKTLRNVAVIIICVALLLTAYFITNRYVAEEIQNKNKRISDLTKQVNTLQEYLNANCSEYVELTSQVTSLTDRVNALKSENEQLIDLNNTKTEQLSEATAEIERLNNRINELYSILESYGYHP